MRLFTIVNVLSVLSLSFAALACSAPPSTDDGDQSADAVTTDPDEPSDTTTAEPERCGGFAHLKCSAGTFCDFGPPGSGCGKGDKSGKCLPKPPPCPEVSAPVCACNGKTFENACEAQRAGFSVSTVGKCAVEDE